MKRYRISYRDAYDAGCPVFSTVVRAYSRHDAERKFLESCDGDDEWRIVAVVELPAA